MSITEEATTSFTRLEGRMVHWLFVRKPFDIGYVVNAAIGESRGQDRSQN